MARTPRGSVRVLTRFTDTVACNNDKSYGAALPKNWDAQAGAGQSMERATARRKMGSKMTPIGRGVTRDTGE